MRLDEQELQAICTPIKKRDPHAAIYLFGSRTDSKKRGGDIDILVLSEHITSSDKPGLLQEIFEKIEEQKIDLVIKKDASDPFVEYILETAIRL